MKTVRLPTVNDEIFQFTAQYYCRDRLPGDRHFLEHMLLNSNKKFTKDELRMKLTMLGDAHLLSACTTTNSINMSGKFLKADKGEAMKCFKSMSEDCLFKEDEIEKERKIIRQEYMQRIDDPFVQAWMTIGNMMNEEFNLVGTLDSINNKITKAHLEEIYHDFINTDNLLMIDHTPGSRVDMQYVIASPGRNLKRVVPNGDHTVDNENMSTSICFIVYDYPMDLKSIMIARCMHDPNSYMFKHLREELNICYMCGASESFWGGNRVSPYFMSYIVTDKDPVEAIAELEKSLILDDRQIFESKKKARDIKNYLSTTDIDIKFNLVDRAEELELRMNEVFEDSTTFEEVLELVEFLKTKVRSRIIVRGTKKKT